MAEHTEHGENAPSATKEIWRTFWILLAIPILFIIGSLMHFVYEWSGESIIVGIFAPTNESIWEHLKMTFWPMLIWWIVGYCLFSKRRISATQWFVSCVVADAFTFIKTNSLLTESLGFNCLILMTSMSLFNCFDTCSTT